MMAHAVAVLITGGSYAMPAQENTPNWRSTAALSRAAQSVDVAMTLSTNTGTFDAVSYRVADQQGLWDLLDEWEHSIWDQPDPDYAAQKAELERSRVSFDF
jgi:hypothetical protein